MEIDAAENVYITGNSDNATGTNTDIVTQKISATGVLQWTKRYDGAATGNDLADAIKVDALGNVLVAGTTDTDTQTATTNNDICLLKYDSNGNQLWVDSYNGTANGDDQATDIALDGSNNIFLTGMINGIANYDYATIKFTMAGGMSNVLTYNGTNNDADLPQSILFKNNFIFVTGSSVGVNSQSDFTTLKYDPATLATTNFTANSSQIKVYPNPAKNFVTVDLSDITNLDVTTLKIAISDMIGRTIITNKVSSTVTELNTQNLRTGTYILQVTEGNKNIATKKIIIN